MKKLLSSMLAVIMLIGLVLPVRAAATPYDEFKTAFVNLQKEFEKANWKESYPQRVALDKAWEAYDKACEDAWVKEEICWNAWYETGEELGEEYIIEHTCGCEEAWGECECDCDCGSEEDPCHCGYTEYILPPAFEGESLTDEQIAYNDAYANYLEVSALRDNKWDAYDTASEAWYSSDAYAALVELWDSDAQKAFYGYEEYDEELEDYVWFPGKRDMFIDHLYELMEEKRETVVNVYKDNYDERNYVLADIALYNAFERISQVSWWPEVMTLADLESAYKELKDFGLINLSVTLNGNGGKSFTKTVAYSQKANLTEKSTRTGYTFTGWFTSAVGGSKVATTPSLINDVTYFAHWNINKYSITFKGNGGKVNSKATYKVTKEYNKTLATSYKAPTRKGYKFTGWYTKAKGGSKVSVTKNTKVTKNVTYYAHWKKK